MTGPNIIFNLYTFSYVQMSGSSTKIYNSYEKISLSGDTDIARDQAKEDETQYHVYSYPALSVGKDFPGKPRQDFSFRRNPAYSSAADDDDGCEEGYVFMASDDQISPTRDDFKSPRIYSEITEQDDEVEDQYEFMASRDRIQCPPTQVGGVYSGVTRQDGVCDGYVLMASRDESKLSPVHVNLENSKAAAQNDTSENCEFLPREGGVGTVLQYTMATAQAEREVTTVAEEDFSSTENSLILLLGI